jgi:putative transposase
MDYRRQHQDGATYFFTPVTEKRRPILVEHIDRLRDAFRQVRDRRHFIIEGIVILPDHLHTLWMLPREDSDYSMRWQQIKRCFSAGLPAKPSNRSQFSKREKGIWQRRFWEHCIRDEEDWRRHLDYIHYNPVKHGFVARVADWPFSSFHRFVEKGWYDQEWGGCICPLVLKMDHE